MGRPKQIDMDLSNVDPNGLFEDQQPVATVFTLDGADVTGGVWTSPDGFPRRIGFESSGNLSGETLTITGFEDAAKHHALTETITGPNAATVETTKYFAHITAVSSSGAMGTNIEAGHVDEAVSQTAPLNVYGGDLSVAAEVTGTIDYTIQVSFDALGAAMTWLDLDDTDLVDVTASSYTVVAAGARALRAQINSYTDTAELKITVVQADA